MEDLPTEKMTEDGERLLKLIHSHPHYFHESHPFILALNRHESHHGTIEPEFPLYGLIQSAIVIGIQFQKYLEES
jgi:hypothetical protein